MANAATETPCFDRPAHVEPLWGINAELKAELDGLVGETKIQFDHGPHEGEENESDYPLVYSVWDTDEDGNTASVLGASASLSEALQEAVDDVRRMWSK